MPDERRAPTARTRTSHPSVTVNPSGVGRSELGHPEYETTTGLQYGMYQGNSIANGIDFDNLTRIDFKEKAISKGAERGWEVVSPGTQYRPGTYGEPRPYQERIGKEHWDATVKELSKKHYIDLIFDGYEYVDADGNTQKVEGRETISLLDFREIQQELEDNLSAEGKLFTAPPLTDFLLKSRREIARRKQWIDKKGNLSHERFIGDDFFGVSPFTTPDDPYGREAQDREEAVFAQLNSDALDHITRGEDLIEKGIDIASGDYSGDLAKSFLESVNEQFSTNLANRGMAMTGMAAMEGTLTGRAALVGLGQSLSQLGLSEQNFGMSNLQQVNPGAFPAFNLERSDVNYARDMSQHHFAKMLEDQHKARKMQGAGETFKRSFAASGGSLLGIGGILGGGGGGYQPVAPLGGGMAAPRQGSNTQQSGGGFLNSIFGW